MVFECASKEDAQAVKDAIVAWLHIREGDQKEQLPIVSGKNVEITNHKTINRLQARKFQHQRNMDPEWYLYDKISQIGTTQAYNAHHSSSYTIGDFIDINCTSHFQYAPGEMPKMIEEYEPIGKFHISVPHDKVTAAWDTIAKTVLDSHLDIDLKIASATNSRNIGKEIVLYFGKHNQDKTVEWQNLLYDIKQALNNAHISSGKPVEGDHEIKNSDGYIFMREGDSVYDRETGNVTNPYTARDNFPLAHIDIAQRIESTIYRDGISQDTPPNKQR